MKLFEPGQIGELTIKNRVIMAAMNPIGLVEPDGRLSQRGIEYYTARARGGAGMITTGITAVSRELETLPSILVTEMMHVTRLSELADSVHDYGAKVAVQLTAGHGRVLPPALMGARGATSPSVSSCFWDSSIMTSELTIKQIENLVKAFEFGAGIVKRAGIDAIELHAHEGYLLDQFQTELWNKRTDKYGGNLKKRIRFAFEVIEAIRRGAGPDFPIIYRFGLTHYLEGAREIDESLEIAREIEAAGVDCLHIDAGCYETWYWAHPTAYQPEGCMVDLAALAKSVVNIPVVTVGKLGDPALAEQVLNDGKADFIAIGRPLLADPEWPNKVKNNDWEDIRPCIADSEGCHGRIRMHKYISCTVNPQTGMEKELAIYPAERPKEVLVIGGGPGGMEAACVAASRGHKVSLWEKSNNLGGNLIPASIPEIKKDYRKLITYMVRQVNKHNIKLELNREVTPEMVRKAKPDAVIIATGARPDIPGIPGIDNEKVITAIDLLMTGKKIIVPVVIIGGGIVGCEVALHLSEMGIKPVIVEVLNDIALDEFSLNRMYLLKMMDMAEIDILTNTSVSEITDDGICLVKKDGEIVRLEAGSVVIATGLKSNRELLETIGDDVPEVYAVGDCVEPGRLINAVWDGFRTARLI